MKLHAWPRRLRGRLGDAQRGFTVIETLVAVSVLGILAAVLTTGLVGVTWMVRQRAADEELHTVQAAYHAMLVDQKVPKDSECNGAVVGTGGTNDMRQITGGAEPPPGMVTHRPASLYPRYIAKATTLYHYYCADNGSIRQADRP